MKYKVTNPPERIFLVMGDVDQNCDFKECEEVMWCEDKQWDSDVEYRLVKRRKRASSRENV
jgi:hypothetical protein